MDVLSDPPSDADPTADATAAYNISTPEELVPSAPPLAEHAVSGAQHGSGAAGANAGSQTSALDDPGSMERIMAIEAQLKDLALCAKLDDFQNQLTELVGQANGT